MNAFVIYYVSGGAFYSGILLIAAAVGLSFCPWWIVRNYFARLFCILGGLNIFFSATPSPTGLLAGLYLLLAVQVLTGGSEKIKLKLRLIIGGILELLVVTVFFIELPYWFSPEPLRLKSNNIVVIGDSISMGVGFDGEKTWPDLLKSKYKYNVANKSVGGGTVATAIESLKKAKVNKDDLIIIEIGGNDFFKGTSTGNFYKNLDTLLLNAKAKTPQVIMLELPLPFLKVSFGRIQRELARKHQVLLIPKRCFASVLSGEKSTVDGLHLSNYGHRKMADMIVRQISRNQPQ